MTTEIKTYEVKGHFKDKGEITNFSRNIRSLSEDDAKEIVYLHFGSKHKIKRQAIKFESIKPSKEDDDQVHAVLSSTEDFKFIKG